MMAQAEQTAEMHDVDVEIISHSINSIQHASETLKRKGAIRTLEEVLTQNMPRISTETPSIAGLDAYIKGQQDFIKGFSLETKLPESWPHKTKEYWKSGWRQQASVFAGMYKDMKEVLEHAPEIEAALLMAGKKRLANKFKKLITPPTPSEEGRSAACV